MLSHSKQKNKEKKKKESLMLWLPPPQQKSADSIVSVYVDLIVTNYVIVCAFGDNCIYCFSDLYIVI